MKNTSKKSDTGLLRQKAEEFLKKKPVRATLSEADKLKLIQELDLHQIELKMQNEELALAKERAELSEEKYTELYDFSPSCYLTLSKEGVIIEMNFSAARIFGKERSRLINSPFAHFISAGTHTVYNLFFQKIFISKTKETCEVILAIEGNSPINVYIEGIVSKNCTQCFLTMVDITKLKRLEIELIQAKIKAEESDRLKSAFLANMSHEIRTPMNGILGFADLLKKPDIKGDQQQKYIGIIKESGTRMLNIINNLIDISKIEAGQVKVFISEININEQIEFIYTFFKPEIEKKYMQFSFKNSLTENEAFIKTDREKLYAIFINLMKNAIKYSDHGSIEFGYNKAGKYLEFFVKDTGIGINKDKQKIIFNRFIQAHNPLTNIEGAGLGLAITKAYVEMLGGRIWVESEPGKGSVFYFTIPYNAELKKKTTINDFVLEDIDENQIKNLKILIAEDDVISKMLLTETTAMVGREILHAKTGVEAVEVCRDNPDIDLVLMDIRMPEIDGYEATMQIRQFNKEVVIIAQTAYALAGEREKAIKAGCDDYISKPFNQASLMGLIQKHFNKYVNK